MKQRMVTIKENDNVLNGFDIINKNRLGNTVKKLNAEEAIYVDFTDGLKVGGSHRFWNKPARKNDAIIKFFEAVFKGDLGEKVKG